MTDISASVRTCDKCSVADTNAHHVQYTTVVHPVTQAVVDLSVTKHIQCCAADGCDICATDVEHAGVAQVPNPTALTAEFTAYMQNKSAPHLQALFERHGIETADFQKLGVTNG